MHYRFHNVYSSFTPKTLFRAIGQVECSCKWVKLKSFDCSIKEANVKVITSLHHNMSKLVSLGWGVNKMYVKLLIWPTADIDDSHMWLNCYRSPTFNDFLTTNKIIMNIPTALMVISYKHCDKYKCTLFTSFFIRYCKTDLSSRCSRSMTCVIFDICLHR